jgi:glycosyltransferase involved in cell wall biosynthesis
VKFIASSQTGRQLWIWYAPFQLGGVETYLLNMAREACAAGDQIWIAAVANADGPLREQFLAIGAQVLDWTAFRRAFAAQEASQLICSRMIEDLARIKPDLVALNDCNDFSIGTAPLLRKVRPFCTIVDTLHIDSPSDEYLGFRRIFLDVLDGIAATNQSIASRFRQKFPASLGVRYIPNGVPTPAKERRPPDETLRVLYVGRLAQEQKRILELPRLLQNLQARGKIFSATIVGDGHAREEFALELSKRGLHTVRMAGYLSPTEVQGLLLSHDVLINLSEFEGFSMSVLEAFAAGCVPVCTEVAGLDRSAFVDGVNCHLFPVRQLERLVDILEELTPRILERMSRESRATGERFTAQRTYERYREFFSDLRATRTVAAWPGNAESLLHTQWDLSQDNPWLPKPHPLRRWAQSAWHRLRASADIAQP